MFSGSRFVLSVVFSVIWRIKLSWLTSNVFLLSVIVSDWVLTHIEPLFLASVVQSQLFLASAALNINCFQPWLFIKSPVLYLIKKCIKLACHCTYNLSNVDCFPCSANNAFISINLKNITEADCNNILSWTGAKRLLWQYRVLNW